MTVLFRITSGAAEQPVPGAQIDARQLTAFLALLRAQGERYGMGPLVPEQADAHHVPPFEVRVCPVSLAAMATVFDHDPDVIGVLEEAQFRGRKVRIVAGARTSYFALHVAATADPGHALDLAESSARLLFEALGIEPVRAGAVQADKVRQRIADAEVKARAEAAGLGRDLTQLERLISTALIDDGACLEWA